MSVRQLLGAVIIALPFVVIFVVFSRLMGWRPTVMIFGLAAAVVAVTGLGVYLLSGD